MSSGLRLLCLHLALLAASVSSIACPACGLAGRCVAGSAACRHPWAPLDRDGAVGDLQAGLLRKLQAPDIDSSVDLLLAARDGDKNAVSRLLAAGAADVEFTDGDGYTPLLWASTNGHLGVVNMLIKGGADVNAASLKGFTPLTEASLKGHAPIVVILLEVGADVSHRSAMGFSALHWAVESNHLEVVRVLLKNGADMEAQTNHQGWTPLNIAAWSGSVGIVEELLQRGVNVSVADFNGVLPAHFAIHTAEWRPVCEALLGAGADINALDNAGDSPLEYASWTGNFGAVRWLLDHGAEESVDVVDAKGKKPWEEVCGCVQGELYTIPCFTDACQDPEENNEIRVLLGGEPVDAEAPGAECKGLRKAHRLKCLQRIQRKTRSG